MSPVDNLTNFIEIRAFGGMRDSTYLMHAAEWEGAVRTWVTLVGQDIGNTLLV